MDAKMSAKKDENMSAKPDAKMDEKKKKLYEERDRRSREFERKHSAFLEELRQIPVKQKEERWLFLGNYVQGDIFKMELMDAYRPGAYDRIRRHLECESDRKGGGADAGIALQEKRELDLLVFMEALKEAIQNYTGINQKGETYRFIECFGLMYKQRADKARARNILEKEGVSGLSPKKASKILKLVKTAREIWQRADCKISEDEVVRQVVKDFLNQEKGEQNTKRREAEERELVELVRNLVLNGNIIKSIDEPVGDGNGGSTWGDFLTDEKDEYELLIEQKEKRFLLERFFHAIEGKWGLIEAAKNRKEQDLIKKFLTRDIVKVLKLDENGNRYLKEPAGNCEIYQLLKSEEDFLCGRLLYQQYLQRALVKQPETLYEVYLLFLREDFDFTDKILAEVMGKDKTFVSKKKKQYRDSIKAIYEYCLSCS